jgi:hypothetical protein
MGLLVLLLLDPGQHFAEMLVLDDGRVADALQMIEDGVGQGQSLQRPTLTPKVDHHVAVCANHNQILELDWPPFLG